MGPAVDPGSGSAGKNLQPLPGESLFAASNSAMAANQGWIWLGTSKARILRTRKGPLRRGFAQAQWTRFPAAVGFPG